MSIEPILNCAHASSIKANADKIEFSGGGMESHRRLTEGTLYRAADNATTMKAARELYLPVLLKMYFNISLSTCYNYTMNFKSETHAKHNNITKVKTSMQPYLSSQYLELEFIKCH